MKISFIVGTDLRSTETRISTNLVPHLEELGATVSINGCDDDYDFILGNTIGVSGAIKYMHERFPHIKLVNYVWDLYPWVVNANMYDFKTYESLLNDSVKIFTPSNEVILRLEEMYGLGSKAEVIKSYAELYEDNNNEVSNKEFILHPVRPYQDPNLDFINRACDELGIELIKAGDQHKFSYEEYKSKVLTCSFLVTEYQEASTGGLSLIEGYYHGKDVLVSDSKYQGARDYFGDRAYYFKDGDYEDFKSKVKMLYDKSLSHKITQEELQDRKNFCMQYDVRMMANNIFQSLKFING